MGPRPRPRDDGSLMSILGILFLVLGLLISVGIHELGHMIPAKKFGVKVSQYFIGFGPTLWSKKAGGTEYGIKALPLGGFVKIAGMIPPGRPGRKELNRRGKLTLAEEARRESASEIGPGEETRAFWRLSAPKKLIVMFGGPLTNLVLCFACLAIVVCGIGLPKATSTVGKVVPCVTQKSECAASDPKSPAAEAGLRAGDEITSWGGRAVKDWKEIQAAIAEGGTDKADVVVRRGGATMTLSITPIATKRPKTDASGKAVKDARGNGIRDQALRRHFSHARTPIRVPDAGSRNGTRTGGRDGQSARPASRGPVANRPKRCDGGRAIRFGRRRNRRRRRSGGGHCLGAGEVLRLAGAPRRSPLAGRLAQHDALHLQPHPPPSP